MLSLARTSVLARWLWWIWPGIAGRGLELASVPRGLLPLTVLPLSNLDHHELRLLPALSGRSSLLRQA